MTRVFLSHASPDKPVVRRIALALRAAGYDTWLDDEDILVGESIPAAVEHGLGDADFVVICLSKAAAKRGWIEAERDAALMQQLRDRRERILPVRLEDVEPPYLLASLAYVDLFPDERAFTEGIARLARSIEAHRGAPRRPRPGPARRMAPARPVPAYPDAEVEALSRRLEDARARRDKLRGAGIAAEQVDREILELRRQLREGGRLRPGDALGDGRYLLVQVVGRGGFAVVWEAYDGVAQQRVAIKVLHANLAGDLLRRERFFRGAKAMMRLTHPAVVRVLEPEGEDGGFYYFVMEFVSGGNLREAVLAQRLSREGRWLPILQVGDALAMAHARGVIHRDIKPSNILLDDRGDAKLTDFDLVGAHDTTGGTRTGALGTIVYAAPECLEKPQHATARADVYGLGMTAIFCLAGRDLSMDTFRNPVKTIARLDCSRPVRRALAQAVEWIPDDRFGDAATMLDALREALHAVAQPTARMNTLRTDPTPSSAMVTPGIEQHRAGRAGSAPRPPTPSPSSRTELVPNRHWLDIVDRLLGEGTDAEQIDARRTLWVQVERYVARHARLPIGPLAKEPDVRLDIAAQLLGRLERDDFRRIRTWRESRRDGRDSATWWGWIDGMARSIAIDVARASRQNLSPRGQPYRWARIVAIDPMVFDEAQEEALRQSLDYLEQEGPRDMESFR